MAKRRSRKGRSGSEDPRADELVVEPIEDSTDEAVTGEVRAATPEEEAALPVVEVGSDAPRQKRRVAKTMIGIPLAEQLAKQEAGAAPTEGDAVEDDAPADEAGAEEPAAEEPAEAPAEEAAAAEEPAEAPAEEAAAPEDETAEEAATEQSAAEEPAEDTAAAEEPTAEEPAAEEPAAEEPAEDPAEDAAPEEEPAEEPAERSSVIEMKTPDSPEFSLLERSVLVAAPVDEDAGLEEERDGLTKGQRAMRRLSPRLLGFVLLLLGGAGVAGTFLTLLNPFRDWFMHLLMYSVIVSFYLLYLKAHARRRPVARYLMMIITVGLAGFFAWILMDYIPAQKVWYARSVLWREAVTELWLPIGLLAGAAVLLFAHCVFVARYAPKRR